jgi:hypothetical protein
MESSYDLFETVVITANMPDHGVLAGDLGAVVEVHSRPQRAYEVEFVNGRRSHHPPVAPGCLTCGADSKALPEQSRDLGLHTRTPSRRTLSKNGVCSCSNRSLNTKAREITTYIGATGPPRPPKCGG